MKAEKTLLPEWDVVDEFSDRSSSYYSDHVLPILTNVSLGRSSV